MIDNQKWSDTGPLWLEGQCRDGRKAKRQMSHQKPPDNIHQHILSIKLYWNLNALIRLSFFYHSPSRWLRQEKIAGHLNHSMVHLCLDRALQCTCVHLCLEHYDAQQLPVGVK